VKAPARICGWSLRSSSAPPPRLQSLGDGVGAGLRLHQRVLARQTGVPQRADSQYGEQRDGHRRNGGEAELRAKRQRLEQFARGTAHGPEGRWRGDALASELVLPVDESMAARRF